MDKEKTYVFKNSYYYSALNSIYSVLSVYFFFKIVFSPVGWDLYQFTKDRDAIGWIITTPFLMYFFPTVLSSSVLLPLMRSMFACTVSKEGLQCVHSFLPFLANRHSIQWKDVDAVEYKTFFLLRYYVLKNKKRFIILYIPFDLERFYEFKKAVLLFAPKENYFRLFLENEKRSYIYKYIPKLDVKLKHFQIVGTLMLSNGDESRPLGHRKICILCHGVVVAECLARQDGQFYLSFHHFPGKYTLRAKGPDYFGEQEIVLPQSKKHNKILLCTRPINEKRNS